MACGISTPLSPGYTETSGILVAIQTTSPSLESQQDPPASTSRCCTIYVFVFLACVTDVAMPVRAVCKPHSPDLKKRRSSD